MINDFKSFNLEHIATLLVSFLIGILFIYLSKKHPEQRRKINIIFAITIFAIRSVRYCFDIYYGTFFITDLFTLHVCNINLYILILCLIFPNKKLFMFTFFLGIPTALSVVLFPGSNHAEPGLLRALFFIMSHSMLVMGSIYLLITNNFKLNKNDLKSYYVVALVGIIVIYIFNIITKANFLYLINAPKGTLLESIYNIGGPFIYILLLYLILILLFTFQFYLLTPFVRENN